MSDTRFTVFTKPWRDQSLSELGETVSSLGFWGVELPIRPGFQVTPDAVGTSLPKAVRALADAGVVIDTVAPSFSEALTDYMIEACAASGARLMRVCVGMPRGVGYLERISDLQRQFETAVPRLAASGISLGVQNHSLHDISHALGLRELVRPFDPDQICAVWDPAHTALNGEIPEHAVDIIWPHLRLLNLENAIWKQVNGPEASVARFAPYWTAGRCGLAPWPDVVQLVRQRGYDAPVCLPAEYTDETDLIRLVGEDLAFARSLFAS